MLKAVFFDNDGVLVDTENVFYEANRIMMKRFGHDLTEESFADFSLRRGLSLLDFIVELGFPREHGELARIERNHDYNRMLAERGGGLVLDGVRETLEYLRSKNIMIGVVTCCMKDHFTTIHNASGLAKYFDIVVGDGDFVQHKPFPEPYLLALSKSGLDPSEVIAVEDSERGVKSARAAGLECYAIPRGISAFGSFSEASGVFSSMREFKNFIDEKIMLR